MSQFNVLVGKRINGLMIGNDAWTLVFRAIDGKCYRFDTGNDCCNTVWFNHVTGINILGDGNTFDLLRGALVTGIEYKDFAQQPESDGYEVIDDAFITIRTDRGYIDLEVRNSHNGYYGGSITYNENDSLDDVEDLVAVTDDF